MSDLLHSSSAAPVRSSSPLLRRCLLTLAGASVAMLGGCAVYTPAQSVYADGGQPVVYTQPAAVQEVVTVRPAVGMVWMPGIWIWGGTRYHWRPGHWAHPSRAYAGRGGVSRWYVPRAYPRGRVPGGGWRR